MILAYFRIPIRWGDVLKRTAHEFDEDNCFGLAAQLAFYFLLALFPALLFFVALLGYMPVENALSDMISALGRVAPREIVSLLREQIEQISRGRAAGLLTIGAIGAIWSSSAAMVAMIDALNHAYDVPEWRSWWKRRLVGILLTLGLAVFILIAVTFVLVGPALASRIAAWFGLAQPVTVAWQIVRWPVMFSCIMLAIDLIYYFAPNRTGRWVWITPGALIATLLWLVSSFGFKFYVRNVANYAATYGTIGGVIVTMLWFYVCGLAVLVGAELNGVIEKAWKSKS